MSKRYFELDAIRGLAAVLVLLHHCALVFPNNPIIDFFNHTPLCLFTLGHESVIMFFVLSGFVLALPFYKHKITYIDYILKRICRIYIPYFIALLIAILAKYFFYSGSIPTLGKWFNDVWPVTVNTTNIVNHFLLIGNFNEGTLVPVFWSLTQEMRISIIFPLLFLFTKKVNWKTALVLSISIFWICIYTENYLLVNSYMPRNNYIRTVQVLYIFISGILLAKHQQAIITKLKSIHPGINISLLFLSIFLFTFHHWFFPKIHLFHLALTSELFTVLGVSIMIIVALSSKRFSIFSEIAIVKTIGKISYSIYLYHAIILISLLHCLFDKLPTALIVLISVTVTFPISWLMWYLIEVPSMKLGQFLYNKHLGRYPS